MQNTQQLPGGSAPPPTVGCASASTCWSREKEGGARGHGSLNLAKRFPLLVLESQAGFKVGSVLQVT